MKSVKKSILIMATANDIYSLARDPERWGHWYANLAAPKIKNGNGEVGTIVECQYNLLGIHFPMSIEVTEDYSSAQECRWTGLIKGPISGKQRCIYQQKDQGTEVIFEIEYSLPEGIIGKIADGVIVEKLQANSMMQTLESLKIFCES